MDKFNCDVESVISYLSASCRSRIMLCRVFDDEIRRTEPERERQLSEKGRDMIYLMTGKQLEHDRSGLPFIRDKREIRLSISHCDPYVACAVGYVPVGIDIEKVRKIDSSVLRKYYTPKQKAELDGLKGSGEIEEANIRYTEMWTVNEAIAKLNGTGLKEKVNTGDSSGISVKTVRYGTYVITVAEMTEGNIPQTDNDR